MEIISEVGLFIKVTNGKTWGSGDRKQWDWEEREEERLAKELEEEEEEEKEEEKRRKGGKQTHKEKFKKYLLRIPGQCQTTKPMWSFQHGCLKKLHY